MKRQRVGCVGWLTHLDGDAGVTTAVCDTREEKVRSYCEQHEGVRAFTDYRKMADASELDVVYVATPNEFHREMAVRFLESGVHVFLEKPMGVDRQEMDAILAAERAGEAHLAIDFELRVSFFGRRVKEIMDAGEIGAPVGVEFVHHRGAWLAETNGVWRTDPARSGGLYFMEVCHEVDLFRHWFGEVEAVQSFSNPNVLPQYRGGMPENVVTHLWFASGVRGVILTNHTSSVAKCEEDQYDTCGHDMAFIVTGTEGSIRIDCIRHTVTVCEYAEHHPDLAFGKRVDLKRTEDHGSMSANEFHHDCARNFGMFVEAMARGEQHHQSAADAWRTHLVCLAAESSARDGARRIEVVA
jgi:predicted dehydrogenase